MSLSNPATVQSRFAETRFAETLTLTLTPNPNFGESGFDESGRHPRYLCCVSIFQLIQVISTDHTNHVVDNELA